MNVMAYQQKWWTKLSEEDRVLKELIVQAEALGFRYVDVYRPDENSQEVVAFTFSKTLEYITLVGEIDEPWDDIAEELTQMYSEKCEGMDVFLRLTSLEVEHLNNLVGIGMSARKGSFLSGARKEKRTFNKWERHLCAMDRKLWKKVREAEKLAFNEKDEELKTQE